MPGILTLSRPGQCGNVVNFFGTLKRLNNNLMSKAVWDRGIAEFTESGNIYNADISNVSCY